MKIIRTILLEFVIAMSGNVGEVDIIEDNADDKDKNVGNHVGITNSTRNT